ncbi:hypothetical protein HanRHA438_Chr11g0488591 [Helianthus annuus]|nr:hypothetical protein HanRHA438_Chr11g0488591 [Helianthus annuus]
MGVHKLRRPQSLTPRLACDGKRGGERWLMTSSNNPQNLTLLHLSHFSPATASSTRRRFITPTASPNSSLFTSTHRYNLPLFCFQIYLSIVSPNSPTLRSTHRSMLPQSNYNYMNDSLR